VLRTFNEVFLGELPEKYRKLKGISSVEAVSMMILMIVTILIGIMPQSFMAPIIELVARIVP
jgi:NADH:ubiquinone oxidoreductase subunit 4 (subunit M)